MPTTTINFGAGEASALDELSGTSPAFLNASVDAAGAIRARPGIRAWSAFPPTPPVAAKVVKMAVFGDKLVYVTDDGGGTRHLCAWVSDGSALDLSLIGGTTLLAGSLTPSIAIGRNLGVVTGGGAPQKITVGMASGRLGGSPPSALDVTMFNNYIVLAANDSSGVMYWAGPGEAYSETWNVLRDALEADARPDPLVGLGSTAGMLFAFGSQTAQTYIPDPNDVFATQQTEQVGMYTKDSLVARGNTYNWLDNQRRFVTWDGHVFDETESILSAPWIASTLRDMSTVSDCWGFRENDGIQDLLVWVFPTEGRCFAYDVRNRSWGERFTWDNGRWVPWLPTAFVHWHERNIMLVGMSDGTICELTRAAYTDLGYPLHWVARTGFDDDGAPDVRKHCPVITVTMRRGEATSADLVNLRWRNDLGSWRGNKQLSLGGPGDVNPVRRVAPCGTYYTRQHELSGSAAAATTITKVTRAFVPEGADEEAA